MLRDLQKNFTDYLQGRESHLSDYIQDDGLVDLDTRLGIYRNAYQIRLRECIDSDHPVLGIYLGDELFDQMVKGYIQKNPSRYTSLRHFADNLPEFLEHNSPFSDHPVIAEIARFERRLMFSFDAAEGSTASLEDLQKIEAPSWPEIHIGFHPSVSLFTTDWNCVEIWQAIKRDSETPPNAQQQKTNWLVWRDQNRLTQYRVMSDAGIAIFSSFREGYSFADVCNLLLEVIPEETVSQAAVDHLLEWLSHGIIEKISLETSD